MDVLNCTCAHCGVGFVTTNKTKMYCSRRCNRDAWIVRNPEANKAAKAKQAALEKEKKRNAPKYTRIVFNSCVTCARVFVAKQKKKYCCPDCHPTAVKTKGNKESLAARVCAVCGKPCGYTFGRAKIYCSKECRHQGDVFKEGRRASKAKRRRLVGGAASETVKPFKVFDRDKWRCQLCGCKTPKSKRNTLSDNAPELDHIIPISKGGDHSYKNTQCACRKCNGLKSNHPRGQMLIFGW